MGLGEMVGTIPYCDAGLASTLVGSYIARQDRNCQELNKTIRVAAEEKSPKLSSFGRHLQHTRSARYKRLIHDSSKVKTVGNICDG